MAKLAIWAYCRVSTRKAEQELSLDQQVAWAQGFARERSATLKVFSERASAKTIMGRAKCVEMLGVLDAMMPEERPAILLATSFDRLSRDITDTLILARALREASVQLYVRDRGFIAMDSFADQASLVGQAMGGHAENEARSNRIKASWQRRRLEGKPTSNKSPYGLQLRNEQDTPQAEAGPWVTKAFEWYAAGLGMSQIARRFQAGAPPHRVQGSRVGPDGAPIVRERHHVWEENRIKKLLVQRRYRGVLVGDALFDRVQELIDAKPRWRQHRKFEYPLSGAVKCATCGRSFHGHATGGSVLQRRLASGRLATYPRYERTRYYGCTVCHYMINAIRLEEWFWRDIDNLRAHPTLIRSFLREGPPKTVENAAEELRSARAELARLERKRQRAWDLALEGSPAVAAQLPDQLRRLDEIEGDLRDRISAAETRDETEQAYERSVKYAKGLILNAQAHFLMAPYDQKRELCSALVKALGGATASKEGLVWSSASLVSAPGQSAATGT